MRPAAAIFALATGFAVLPAASRAADTPYPTLAVDWASFLARSDLLWAFDNSGSTQKPDAWYEGTFHGNGALGCMLWGDNTGLRLDISRTDVYDDREPNTTLTAENNFVYDRPRLPIGHFLISWPGVSFVSFAMRLRLWDAVTVGTLATSAGTVSFRLFANSDYNSSDVLILEVDQVQGEWGPTITFVPEPALSTWADQWSGYTPNPSPTTTTLPDGTTVVLQRHLSRRNSSHATGFRTVATSATQNVTFITVSPVLANGSSPATAWVQQQIAQGVQAGSDALYARHAAWWAAYYPASFVSFDESVVESFYWIQMYKMASATRADRVVHDLQGPWFVDGTPWPDLHWDMNLQELYYVVYGANRLSLGQSLLNFLASIAPNLVLNVPAEWRIDSAAAPTGASALDGLESCYWDTGVDCLTTPPSITGNLLWTMHLVYTHYRYADAGDREAILTTYLWPILRRAVNAYLHFQINGTNPVTGQFDGQVHLPTTFSPEYNYRGADTNYDLALLRWGLTTAIGIAQSPDGQRLNLTDANLPTWVATLAHLTDYPIDEFGFMIARNVSLTISHRHYSHLFMLWPLETLDLTNATNAAIAKLSVDHWIGMPGGLTGFCRPAVSAMNQLLGRPTEALSNITYLIQTYMLPNTMYKEGDGPCTETPYAGAMAIQNALLMEYNGTLRIFSGINDSLLHEPRFFNLRAPGGFLVSGARALDPTDPSGNTAVTAFVAVESRNGEDLVIEADLAAPWVASPASVQLIPLPPTGLPGSASLARYRVLLPVNGTVVLTSASQSQPVNTTLVPAAGCPAEFNAWGLPPAGFSRASIAPCGPNGTQPDPATQTFDFNATTGTFTLRKDGRCLSISGCVASDGVEVVVEPCVGTSPTPVAPGCGGSVCSATTQQWSFSNAPFANRLQLAAGGSTLCLDVPGATGPWVDVWTCDDHVGQYLNQEWFYDAATGALVAENAMPGWGPDFCLTVDA